MSDVGLFPPSMLPVVVANSSPAVDRVAKLAAFCHFFGISRGPSIILVSLYDSAPLPRAAEQLAQATFGTVRSVQQQMSLLRNALESEAIDFDIGGYSLTEIGLAECAEAMRQMRASLAA